MTPTILPATLVELAILEALPAEIVTATTLYATANRAHPDLAYGQFWEGLMALDRRGLVVTNCPDRADGGPPEVTVAHPHLDRPIR